MKQKHELGALVLAAMLLLCVSYLTQCRSTSRRSEPVAAATATSATRAASQEEERERNAERRKSVREFAAEEEKEERQKIEGISRALRTAGANPEFRRTYGFPP